MNVTLTFQLLALPSDILYSQRKMLEWNSILHASQAATKQKVGLTPSSTHSHHGCAIFMNLIRVT